MLDVMWLYTLPQMTDSFILLERFFSTSPFNLVAIFGMEFVCFSDTIHWANKLITRPVVSRTPF